MGASLLVSLAGHLLFFGALLLLTSWFEPGLLELGGGPGGGSGGEIITVGLSDQLSGGAGMVKPSLTPQPEAAPPPPPEKPQPEPEPAEEAPEKPVFEVKDETPEPQKEPQRRPPAPPRKVTSVPKPSPGVIPGEPRPGSGGAPAGGAGSGGGLGTGVGVQLGSGSGGGGLESWYLRQVERRISENWLRTALGRLENRVEVSVSFEIDASGRIDSLRVQRSSGIRSVDLSAERAVRASSPLPPLPPEFRRRRVRFVANFEYPPR